MRTLQEIDAERNEVLEKKSLLESEAEHIKLKIQDAKARVRNSGEYADQDWWYRANDALRIKKGEIRKLAQRLSQLKAERSEAGQALHVARTANGKEVTSLLYKIARLSDEYLMGMEEEDFCGKMEDLLQELEGLKPDWKENHE